LLEPFPQNRLARGFSPLLNNNKQTVTLTLNQVQGDNKWNETLNQVQGDNLYLLHLTLIPFPSLEPSLSYPSPNGRGKTESQGEGSIRGLSPLSVLKKVV